MAEFSLSNFANDIRQNIYDNFPYESDEIKAIKHAKRPLHIRDIALGLTYISNGQMIFEIGNDYAEEYYPYYHILEDAEVIRKKGRGTKLSKGSQAEITKLSDRDYGRISFNGKTFSREYQKNVRGARSRVEKATYNIFGSDVRVYKVNKDANYYKNIHFHYIERILNNTLPWIAQANGVRMGRTEISSLESDYESQEQENLITSIMSSFMED